ncbi:MAG: hypothetical protein ABIK07_03640, partial [Planctomycetota bacterium]
GENNVKQIVTNLLYVNRSDGGFLHSFTVGWPDSAPAITRLHCFHSLIALQIHGNLVNQVHYRNVRLREL